MWLALAHTEDAQGGTEVRGKGRMNFDFFLRFQRVGKFQCGGMQHLPRDAKHAQVACIFETKDAVANDGGAHGCEVAANLICAACLDAHAQKTCVVGGGFARHFGNGVLSIKRCIDYLMRVLEGANRDGVIDLGDAMRLEHFNGCNKCRVILRKE